MERRNFLKTMGLGAISMAVSKNLLTSCTTAKFQQLPSFGTITGSGGQWHQDGFRAGLKQLAEWGYTELQGGSNLGDMQPNEVKAFLKSLGLVSISGSVSMANLIGDETLLKTSLARSLALDHKYVHCTWPWIREIQGKKIDDYKVVADNLNRGGKICQSEGIQLLYHNHDFEFYSLEGQMPFEVLMAGLDSSVGIELDTYWCAKGGSSCVEYLKKYPGKYPILHIKDMPANVVCGKGPTDFSKLTDDDFCPIGSGVIDWPEIFKTNSISGAKYFIVEADKPGNIATFLELSAKYLLSVKF